MGIFDKLFGKKKEKAKIIAQELQGLKNKIFELPRRYPTGVHTSGSGVAQAQEQIPIICRNIDEAIRALNTGLDPHNRPITKSQIADGIKCLVNATRNQHLLV